MLSMPRNPRSNETVLNPATKEGSSLRTTIPAFIKDQFGLEKGDRLRWTIDGERLVVEIVK